MHAGEASSARTAAPTSAAPRRVSGGTRVVAAYVCVSPQLHAFQGPRGTRCRTGLCVRLLRALEDISFRVQCEWLPAGVRGEVSLGGCAGWQGEDQMRLWREA